MLRFLFAPFWKLLGKMITIACMAVREILKTPALMAAYLLVFNVLGRVVFALRVSPEYSMLASLAVTVLAIKLDVYARFERTLSDSGASGRLMLTVIHALSPVWLGFWISWNFLGKLGAAERTFSTVVLIAVLFVSAFHFFLERMREYYRVQRLEFSEWLSMKK
jgi:hypothetical protein